MAIEALNLKELGELNDDGPITMVNLIRLRDRSADGNGSGWDAYKRYSSLIVPMIKSRGGTVIWTGKAEAIALGVAARTAYDFISLVQYPSMAAFVDMMTSAEYENVANPHRVNGTVEHVIVAAHELYSKL
jgi:uncharacterized protein (DUF1330 family)